MLRHAAGSRESHRASLRDAKELVRKERRIGGGDDDDRLRREIVAGEQIGNLAADQDAVDSQHRPRSVVRLHEHADRPSALVLRHSARRRADAAFELVGDHAGSAADRAFSHCSTPCVLDRGGDVLVCDLSTLLIVQRCVRRLRHDRHRTWIRVA